MATYYPSVVIAVDEIAASVNKISDAGGKVLSELDGVTQFFPSML